MLVKDLDGREYEWKPRGKSSLFNTNASGLAGKAREILREQFPTQTILEEVSIKVTRNKTLYFDFYIPMLKAAFEVHGAQHFSFNSKFHKTKRDFIKQRNNDRQKEEWCEINSISLSVLRYDEEDNWREQI